MTTTYNCIIHENPDINAFYVVDLAKTVDLYFKWNTPRIICCIKT